MKTNLSWGIVGLLILFVMISGCTSTSNQKTETLIGEYNITLGGEGLDSITTSKTVPLNGNFKTIKIEYSNLTQTETANSAEGIFKFITLDVTNLESQELSKSIIAEELVTTNPPSGTIELNANGAKSISIVAIGAKGTVKVIAIT